jgi:PAS domain-containing protein
MNQKKSPQKSKNPIKSKIGKKRDFSISENVKNKERLRLLADLCSSISDVVYATDLELNVTYWNHSAEKVYGWKEKDVLGRSVIDVTGSKLDSVTREKLKEGLLKKG